MSRARKRRTLRVLVLMHPDFVPPTNVDAASEREAFEWKTEYDVLKALRTLGHEVQALGVSDELRPIRQAVDAFQPHVVFNLLEEFHGLASFDHHVVSYLSLIRVPFRILTEDEEKLLGKNYKDIRKQVQEAFTPRKK